MKYTGDLLKLEGSYDEASCKVNYKMPLGKEHIDLMSLIGKKVKLSFAGVIHCVATGEKIKKSYNSGYSYKAFMRLAECDTCIVKPELCHFHLGTCREPSWGEEHCKQPHIVYIANSSGLKVGITRKVNTPYRWIDQGAVAALPLVEVKDRLTSGLIEVELAKVFKDKTNWRAMLQAGEVEVDLEETKELIFNTFGDLFDDHEAVEVESPVLEFIYPVLEYPKKVTSLTFDKEPVIEGTLMGIKGQYLIFDIGVVNMRRHQGYELTFEA